MPLASFDLATYVSTWVLAVERGEKLLLEEQGSSGKKPHGCNRRRRSAQLGLCGLAYRAVYVGVQDDRCRV